MRKAREIVVRTEESNAEPGEGWWNETIFLELPDRWVAVFRMTDEQERPTRIRTLPGPLTWRRVVRSI